MIQDEINTKVSIIIPSRNIDFLLKNSVEKISQLYPDVKIIIVLDEYNRENIYSNDNNIHIIKSDNHNMSAKRNAGVRFANTEYIALIDSDAYPKDNWLELAIKFLSENKDYSAVTGCQYNFPNDDIVQHCLRLVRFNRLFTHQEWCVIIDKNSQEHDCTEFMTSNVIMRKKDYIDLGGMNEELYLAEDNEFSQRMTLKGYKIRFLPEVTVFHRESKFYPFFRKVYCMSYYYSNMTVKGQKIKNFKQTIMQYFPLLAIIFFVFLWLSFMFFKLNPYVLLIFPFLVILLLLKESAETSKKLEKNKIKGTIIIFAAFVTFCFIWVLGTLLGTINFPTKKIQNCYKHY